METKYFHDINRTAMLNERLEGGIEAGMMMPLHRIGRYSQNRMVEVNKFIGGVR